MLPVELSKVYESKSVKCCGKCNCEGDDSCDRFLTDFFMTDGVVGDHHCGKDCNSCMCSKIKALLEHDSFKFSVVGNLSEEKLLKLHPSLAVDDKNEDETKIYSKDLSLKQIVRKFKVKRIEPTNYLGIRTSVGLDVEKICSSLVEKFGQRKGELHVKRVQTKNIDVFSKKKLKEKKIKETVPKNFGISFFNYFEFAKPFACGGCIKKVTEHLNLIQYRDYEFFEMKYLMIESDNIIDANKIAEKLKDINRTVKSISFFPCTGENEKYLKDGSNEIPIVIEIEEVEEEEEIDIEQNGNEESCIENEKKSKDSCYSLPNKTCSSKDSCSSKKKESCCSSKTDSCSSKETKDSCCSKKKKSCCSSDKSKDDSCCSKKKDSCCTSKTESCCASKESKDSCCSKKKKSCCASEKTKDDSCCSKKKESCCSSKTESCCASKETKDSCCSKKKDSCCALEVEEGECYNSSSTCQNAIILEEMVDIEHNQFSESDDPTSALRVVFLVDGMTCGNCATKVKSHLMKQSGISKCEVSMMSTKAFIHYDPTKISEDEIGKKIKQIGFKPSKVIDVDDGNVLLCGFKLKKPQISEVVNLFKNTDEISIEEYKKNKKNKKEMQFLIKFEGKWTPRKIINFVKKETKVELDMEKGTFKSLEASLMKKKEIRFYFWHFLFSFVFTFPAMVFALFFGNIVWFGEPKIGYNGTGIYYNIWRGINIKTIVLFLLCTPVQFISGFIFYKKAIKLLLFSRSIDKNTLITVSCWTAYIVSIVSWIYSMFDENYLGKNYMEGSAMLICFLMVGQWLENIATRKTSMSIVKLLKRLPDQAYLVEDLTSEEVIKNLEDEQGVETKQVNVNLLWPGDIVEVKIGGKIPTDGIVIFGKSEINQAMITGESVYVEVIPGKEVIGGTINISAPIYIKILKSTKDNVLSKIIQMIEDAQLNKPVIQDKLDKVSKYFVPTIIAIAIAVLLLWLVLTLTGAIPKAWLGNNNAVIFSILQATSTLVIACPCALGLAVPLVIMVSNGIGAKYGVIVKGGSCFEQLIKSQIICFDKTGTLTQGALTISDVFLFDKSIDLKKLMCAIGGAELSIPSHPIAETIIQYVKKEYEDESLESYKPRGFEHVNGKGLKCKIKPITTLNSENENESLLIGKLALLEDEKVEIESKEKLEDICGDKTRVFVAHEGKIVAIFTLVDQLRPEIKKVIKELRKMKKKIVMLTGDHKKVAEKIGCGELGMNEEDVLSELTPIGKANYIKELQKENKTVVFVGDGVNDSVGLSQADVGISLKSGTEIAMECSSIVLMKNSMFSLLFTFHLAKKAYLRIKLNIFWAFVYNIISVPIAAGILFPIPGFRMIVPPWICAILMTLSCLSVTLNTILFRIFYSPSKSLKKFFKEEKKKEKERKEKLKMEKEEKKKTEKEEKNKKKDEVEEEDEELKEY